MQMTMQYNASLVDLQSVALLRECIDGAYAAEMQKWITTNMSRNSALCKGH